MTNLLKTGSRRNDQRENQANCTSAPGQNTYRRRGAIAVTFAVILVVLIGLLGLVIDTGLLLAAHRQVYNAADAGVLAAAMTKFRGGTDAAALAVANEFIQVENGLSDAPDLVDGTTFHIPPISGPYKDNPNYVEVIVTAPSETLFIQILGVNSLQQVTARAVAGFESVPYGGGVIVLDPDARPGLNATGNGILRVDGKVLDNSEGGGKDKNGEEITCFSNLGVALSAGKDGVEFGIFAREVIVVGGVDKPDLIKPFDPSDPSPLRTCQIPVPDPLINLATPTISNGVDPTNRGTPAVTGDGVEGLDTDEAGQNYLADEGEIIAGGLFTTTVPLLDGGTVILHPGIYESISITGGNLYLIPGIYVIAPKSVKQNPLKLTGGLVIAEGVMFYNTGSSYSPGDGTPDINDYKKRPPDAEGAHFGGVQINDGMVFTPIDTANISYSSLYTGAAAVSSEFDGMLFFQRRRNTMNLVITGGSGSGVLAGTVYAKWAKLDLSGAGTYDAKFVLGSLDISGNANVTLGDAGAGGTANNVFLVE